MGKKSESECPREEVKRNFELFLRGSSGGSARRSEVWKTPPNRLIVPLKRLPYFEFCLPLLESQGSIQDILYGFTGKEAIVAPPERGSSVLPSFANSAKKLDKKLGLCLNRSRVRIKNQKGRPAGVELLVASLYSFSKKPLMFPAIRIHPVAREKPIYC